MPVVIAVPGSEAHADRLCPMIGGERGVVLCRRFPDGEFYVRVETPVQGRDVVLVCTLNGPSDKILPLLFLAATAKDLGAARVGLVAPYLAFMRQDHRFHPGEGITSTYFASMLSGAVDWLVTVDPHLHRWASLDAIYRIPSRIARAAPGIAAWVQQHVSAPLLVGPDAESEQWVSAVARLCDAPHIVLEKVRRGDRDVSVSAPQVDGHRDRTPVLVDDIISTAKTMIETVVHLRRLEMPPPICVGVHAVFADNAHDDLLAAGAAKIVTCNTVAHHSNQISVDAQLAEAVRAVLG
jgi:ribose-phosphate pyrophosphokinase